MGPRPFIAEYLSHYSKNQSARLAVKPGLTGWMQINGRNELTWEEKIDLDVWYVQHKSWRLDLRILLRTPAASLGQGNLASRRRHDAEIQALISGSALRRNERRRKFVMPTETLR